MTRSLGALTLWFFLKSSAYATAKKESILGIRSYSSNGDRNLFTPSWQKRGGLIEPRDETLAIADLSCFDYYLKYSRSMSLSASGNVLAIGYEMRDDHRCYYSRTGVVEVYEYSFPQQKWLARGSIISDKGSRASLSADGNILITGQYEGGVGPGIYGTSGGGVVYAFQYDVVAHDWKPMGEILNLPDNPKDASLWHFGYSVATSRNGQMIAIGNPGKRGSDYYDGCDYYDPDSRGRIHIYRHNGDATWAKVGTKIEGTVDGERLGMIVSLSEDGSIVATASYDRIEVYQMDDQDEWLQLGEDIESNPGPSSMSLSTNGKYIAAQQVVYKYSSSDDEWTALLENSTWVSGPDQIVLSIVDDDEEIFFKHQGASASSYGPTAFGTIIAAPDEEGDGIQTESYSQCVEKNRSKFYLKAKLNKEGDIIGVVKKKCKWLLTRPEKRRTKICKRNKSNKKFGSAKDVCRVTCGTCKDD